MIPAVIERCAGIDVGKRFLAVCVTTGAANEAGNEEVHKLGTIRAELERLREWLSQKLRLHRCGDGKHWLLLETSAECSGRRYGISTAHRVGESANRPVPFVLHIAEPKPERHESYRTDATSCPLHRTSHRGLGTRPRPPQTRTCRDRAFPARPE